MKNKWCTCLTRTIIVSLNWNKDAKEGVVVAGGRGYGGAVTQLSSPRELFVDTSGTLYVADRANHAIIIYPKRIQQGKIIVVAAQCDC